MSTSFAICRNFTTLHFIINKRSRKFFENFQKLFRSFRRFFVIPHPCVGCVRFESSILPLLRALGPRRERSQLPTAVAGDPAEEEAVAGAKRMDPKKAGTADDLEPFNSQAIMRIQNAKVRCLVSETGGGAGTGTGSPGPRECPGRGASAPGNT